MRRFITILLLGLMAFIALTQAQVVVEDAQVLDEPAAGSRMSNISIEVRTTFPDSAVQGLGMFYNGRVSRVDVAIVNKEPDPITVQLIGGAFQDIATLKPIQNLTAKQYNTPIQPGQQQTLPFSVQAYFPGPRVLHLSLAVQFSLKGQLYQSIAHNGTVTIADPPQSVFDPQAWFLYLVLASAIGGIAYFIYSTWIKTVITKKTRTTKNVKKKEPVYASGAVQNYEEWIPQHHLKKDAVSSKKRKGGRATSPSSPGSQSA